MNKTEQIVSQFERRKRILESAGYKIDEFGFGDLIVVEMFALDRRTGRRLVGKQEGIAFLGKTPFQVECHKLQALDRLADVLPRMMVARMLRIRGLRQP